MTGRVEVEGGREAARSARGAMLAVLAVFLVVAVASGCSDEQVSGPSSPVAPEGFTSVTLLVIGPDGEAAEWCVWLADEPDERARGLMEVTDLGGKAGMAFVWPGDTAGSFYMRNTRLPLSIVFVDGSGRVVSDADMEPCPDDVEDCPLTSAGAPYRWALEVPRGGLSELGIDADSRLELGGDCPAVSSAA